MYISRFLILFLFWGNSTSFYLAPDNGPLNLNSYFKNRHQLLKEHSQGMLGSQLRLNKLEEAANLALMKLKYREIEQGHEDPLKFWASQQFHKAKPHIEKSQVFQIIKKVPKGASLHAHSSAMVSFDYLWNNLTYRENLYVKTENDKYVLHFYNENPGDPWELVSEARKANSTFDETLKSQLSLNRIYTNSFEAWKKFEEVFDSIGFLFYQPVLKDYFYQALKELYEDNIKYTEFRGSLGKFYDSNNVKHNNEETFQLFEDVLKEFTKVHPDFIGAKVIISSNRFINSSALESKVKYVEEMKQKFPNLVAGFDLVGEEDKGKALQDFIPSLLKLKSFTNLFLHAGETLWNGATVDNNLIDAVLLNASRIGHAYAIIKHPEVLRLVKERNIALEICPISNQVLGLIGDLRNHPASYLIANSYPIVITADDPGIWDSRGLSYDWYVAFMAIADQNSDLRFLKQLAMNSIQYSTMDEEVKIKAFKQWEEDWNVFVKNFVNLAI